ncbi:rhamnogalacturonan lyase [Saccharicrinis fermentans]|uniref:Rhamnogalacturonan endolyase YesW n=1 Tax=Saccharicrinis fermentans DSM 9555 = JCM 21142 TaxID=869213 RepID=W7YCE8_9BACT|nr:rhamnogalacturonan lyase [Saccharicrinis fermentans]GAF02121.1 rhamnogalacturonan endolyase YesW precursor [Saccharicrinis fermentans DSM 9555 = JCM 21142]
MYKVLISRLFCAFFAILFFTGWVDGQILKGPNYSSCIQKEQLGRGLIAIQDENGDVFITWRYLPSDDVKRGFDVYRKTGSRRKVKLNEMPLLTSTFFRDKTVNTSVNNEYLITDSRTNRVLASYMLTPQKATTPYVSIPIRQFPGDSLWSYSPNDASLGDLDGDGEMEIILKRENSGKDNSHRGVCDGGTLIEAYALDGRFLWRIDLGTNIRQGAHYTQILVYDFDGDGLSEVVVKTAEGTVFGDGSVMGDINGDGITDYVDRDVLSLSYGKIMSGPEFLSVIEGKTGKELARCNYISRGKPNEFGDRTGNRVDRFLAGIAYLDGFKPSILICRGYYEKTVLEAWDFRMGKLSKRWHFSTDSLIYENFKGQGNHSLAVGDVDGDGKDEVTYGACLIDDDGSGGYNTQLGHGDAMHLTDIDIERPGLEVWDCHEHVPTRAGSELRDAATGALLWGIPSVEDVGRAMAADIDPRFKGVELWTTHSGGVYTANGRLITQFTPSVNMGLWWDGDLNRELLDGSGVTGKERIGITKWNGDGIDELHLPREADLAANNWTKGNPCLQVDMVGDWREELLVRTKDNKEIRLYVTPFNTKYRFYTLLSDHMYRLSAAIQNVGYNQPTQLGYYLGSDLGKFWNDTYRLGRAGHSKSGWAKDGHVNDMNTRYKGLKGMSWIRLPALIRSMAWM